MGLLVYETATGRVIKLVTGANSHDQALNAGESTLLFDGTPDGYVDISTQTLVPFPLRPSVHHTWDWTTKSWLPNFDAAREAKLQQVAVELGTRLYLPCNGFDADPVSRGRISGTIARLQRGNGLPAGWIGWRDASNQQRWAEDDAMTVLTNLTALSCAIEDREQALLLTSWQHKANLNALEDFAAILSYDTTAGWPS